MKKNHDQADRRFSAELTAEVLAELAKDPGGLRTPGPAAQDFIRRMLESGASCLLCGHPPATCGVYARPAGSPPPRFWWYAVCERCLTRPNTLQRCEAVMGHLLSA